MARFEQYRAEPWWHHSVPGQRGAPVSVPVTWDELDDPELRPDRWTIRTVPERLRDIGDLLAQLIGTQQELPRL